MNWLKINDEITRCCCGQLQWDLSPTSTILLLVTTTTLVTFLYEHVNSVCRSSFFHLHNISSIRRVLDMKTTGIIVQALVISPLDNCNFLLCGLPAILIKRLQKIQNAAARVIAKACRRDHISPILFKHIVLYMASPQLTSKSC